MIKFMIALSVAAASFSFFGLAAIALGKVQPCDLDALAGGFTGAYISGWIVVFLARRERSREVKRFGQNPPQQ